VFLVHLQLNIEVGQLSNDAEELFHGDSGGARFFNFCFHAAGNGDIQVRGGEFQPVTFGAQEDVGENGQGGSSADDVLHRLEAIDDLLFRDGQIHGVLNISVFN